MYMKKVQAKDTFHIVNICSQSSVTYVVSPYFSQEYE